MKHHTVEGSGGARLHLAETGNPQGRPILFIHGFSQCWLAWGRQLDSELAEDFRLVAMDMRGHGLSEERGGYNDAGIWAEDVHAAVRGLGLERPVLCGWSYGSLVILDYVRRYGEEGVGGLHFVAGITKLGSEDALSVLTPEFLGLAPGLFSTDVRESVGACAALLRMCFAREPSAEELYLMLGYNLSVPPHVRQAMFSRSFDNDDLLPGLTSPVLVTHGADDAIVNPSVVERHWAGVAHAQVHLMRDAGHASFWDDPAAFNRRLREFAESL